MKINLILCSLAFVMISIACNNSGANNQDAQVDYQQLNQSSSLNLTSGTNSDTIVNPTGTNTISLPAAPVKSTAALNPAHGQPGHRCDISVGAPLDSKPIQGTNISQQSTNVSTPSLPVNISSQATTQKVAPGMNPAHGQPGHRCDIAVGAPLNSKPAASPLPPPAPALPLLPVKTDSTKN